jgi:hypothetical protein
MSNEWKMPKSGLVNDETPQTVASGLPLDLSTKTSNTGRSSDKNDGNSDASSTITSSTKPWTPIKTLTNWSGSISIKSTSQSPILFPETEPQIQDIIRHAASQIQKVRVVGSMYSYVNSWTPFSTSYAPKESDDKGTIFFIFLKALP